MKLTLPVCFPYEGNILSAIDLKRHKVWLHSSFIQIINTKDTTNFDIRVGMNALFKAPFLQIKRVKTKDYIKNLTERIIEDINLNTYVYLLAANQKYIPNCKKDFEHELFVYGYSTNTQEFSIADFINGKYECTTCNFSELVNAMDFSSFKNTSDVILMKYNPNEVEERIDLLEIRSMLMNYVFPERNMDWNLSQIENYLDPTVPQGNFSNHGQRTFGVQVYNDFAQYIDLIENGKKIDFRPFQSLYMHKQYMLNRIHYLEKFFLKTSISKEFENDILKKTLIMRNVLIRFSTTHDISALDTIRFILNSIIKDEVKLIKMLIKNTE